MPVVQTDPENGADKATKAVGGRVPCWVSYSGPEGKEAARMRTARGVSLSDNRTSLRRNESRSGEEGKLCEAKFGNEILKQRM